MVDLKIGIVGAAGRMGGAVVRQVTETDGCAVVAAYAFARGEVLAAREEAAALAAAIEEDAGGGEKEN